MKFLSLHVGAILLFLLLLVLPTDIVQPRAYAIPPIVLSVSPSTDTAACLPDCFASPFGAPKLHKILVPGYGWFMVKYRTRYACNTWYDVYIDWIVALNSNGVDPMAAKSMQFILETITTYLLKENPMQFPPLPGTNPPCNVNWRVIKGNCWSRTNVGSPPCPVQYGPCNAVACCLEPYQVCLNPSGERMITKMPYGWSSYSCNGNVPPPGGSPCEPACGYPAANPQN